MGVYQKWVVDIPGDDRHLVVVEIVQVIYDVDTPASRTVSRFDDPSVTFGFLFLKLNEMSMEIIILAGKHVGIWDEIVFLGGILLLGFHEIVAKTVFARYLVAHWEMVDSLEFVQTFVQERFA